MLPICRASQLLAAKTMVKSSFKTTCKNRFYDNFYGYVPGLMRSKETGIQTRLPIGAGVQMQTEKCMLASVLNTLLYTL
jgi:hypothetical protein